MDWPSIASGGGVVGLAVMAYYLGKLALGAWRERRKHGTAEVADTATANAILTRTVETLQKENARLVSRVEALENDNTEKDRQIDALSDKIRHLQEEMGKVADELSEFKRRHGKGM